MKWLMNGFDPRDPEYDSTVMIRHGETPEQAIQRSRAYLKDKIIGPPKATEYYTVEQLESDGMVGIYKPETPDDRIFGKDQAGSEPIPSPIYEFLKYTAEKMK
jgi:hypothetical protein